MISTWQSENVTFSEILHTCKQPKRLRLFHEWKKGLWRSNDSDKCRACAVLIETRKSIGKQEERSHLLLRSALLEGNFRGKLNLSFLWKKGEYAFVWKHEDLWIESSSAPAEFSLAFTTARRGCFPVAEDRLISSKSDEVIVFTIGRPRSLDSTVFLFMYRS